MPRNNSKQRREQRRQRITNPAVANADELNKQLNLTTFAEAVTYKDGHMHYFGEHSPFCQCHLERALREQAKGAS